jgi:uncharacterized protein YbjT (DUF2867 family)
MILVVGATGQVGSMISQQLVEKGEKVRALVRETSDYIPLVKAGAEAYFGDLRDPESVMNACRGCQVVVTTANSIARGREDNVQTVDMEGNRTLIDAARARQVQQFVFVSCLGATEDHSSPFFQAKAKTEQYLRASGLQYTILAPEPFMEVWFNTILGAPLAEGRPLNLVGEGNRKHSFISMGDVARYAVASIGRPEAMNRFIPLGGPAAVSWQEVIHTFERLAKVQLPVHHAALGGPVEGMPEDIVEMLNGMESYDSFVDMAEAIGLLGISPTSMEEVVQGMAEKLKGSIAVPA